MIRLLKKWTGIQTAHDRAQLWNAQRITDNNELKARMKPKDNTRGFMFDPDKPQGVVMPLDKEKFLEVYQNPKKGKENALRKESVRACAKAFNDNNNTHLMITVYVKPDGEVRLLEGNHRLELLRQGSDDVILANVINNSGYDQAGFDESVNVLMQECGRPDVQIEQHGDVVFCNIDYDGHHAHTFEERVTAPYYTVQKTDGAALASRPS